jgi:hypothetical protein
MYIIRKNSVYENFYFVAYIGCFMELWIPPSYTLRGRVGVNFIVRIQHSFKEIFKNLITRQRNKYFDNKLLLLILNYQYLS